MLQQTVDGLTLYRFASLITDGMVHAVFSRLGGVSVGPLATLNVGSNVGDDPAAVAENHARIYDHLGLNPLRVTSAKQVHGNRVAVVTASDAGKVFPSTDGLITRVSEVPLLLRFADCQPIILFDPIQHTLGLAHAGWRGLALGIARRAVEAMQTAFGTQPSMLLAGLGPAIGPCCYQVGHDVASAMSYALPDWREVMSPHEEGWRLDLPAANAQQLGAAGVRRIEQAGICTSCHNSQFFSHRAEQGLTGRFAVVAYLARSNDDLGEEFREGSAAQHEVQDLSSPLTLNPPGFPTFRELERGSL